MKRKLFWSIIILSWIFILSSCSQEKCEDSLSSQYTYKVYLLNELGDTTDVRFCDKYWKEYGVTETMFSYDYCNKGKLQVERFKSDNYKIELL